MNIAENGAELQAMFDNYFSNQLEMDKIITIDDIKAFMRHNNIISIGYDPEYGTKADCISIVTRIKPKSKALKKDKK